VRSDLRKSRSRRSAPAGVAPAAPAGSHSLLLTPYFSTRHLLLLTSYLSLQGPAGLLKSPDPLARKRPWFSLAVSSVLHALLLLLVIQVSRRGSTPISEEERRQERPTRQVEMIYVPPPPPRPQPRPVPPPPRPEPTTRGQAYRGPRVAHWARRRQPDRGDLRHGTGGNA
jgi:hypothetical protein